MSEQAFLSGTRSSYDVVAADYAEASRDSLADRPVDRALLGAFADLVQAGGGSTVADIGCGPGHITAYLHDLGLAAFGVDLSPAMIVQARRAHPDLSFREGSMTKLDLPAGSVDGILALYSIIHLPADRLPEVFAEFARVLSPGGQLLLVFQLRREAGRLTEWFDRPVELAYDVLAMDDVVHLLADAGLRVHLRTQREPDGIAETLPRAYVMASTTA